MRRKQQRVTDDQLEQGPSSTYKLCSAQWLPLILDEESPVSGRVLRPSLPNGLSELETEDLRSEAPGVARGALPL